MKKVILLFVLLVGGISLPGLSLAQAVIDGRVLEDQSSAPLANVIVTVIWAGSTGGEGSCLHSAAALTDANGYYRVLEWRHPARIRNFPRVVPVVSAYLAGYAEAKKNGSPGTIYLARDPAPPPNACKPSRAGAEWPNVRKLLKADTPPHRSQARSWRKRKPWLMNNPRLRRSSHFGSMLNRSASAGRKPNAGTSSAWGERNEPLSEPACAR